MQSPGLSSHTLIADLLTADPQAANTLLELRVDCLGCDMNVFCTIEDLCRQYGLELETIMELLKVRK